MEKEHRGEDSPNQRDSTGKRLRPAHKYLYVALDDIWGGFSIHKIDMESHSLESNEVQDCMLGSRHLPELASVRINAQIRGIGGMFFAAMGSKIFVTAAPENSHENRESYIYDTETCALYMGHRLPVPLNTPFSIAMALGEMVYVLSSHCIPTDRKQNLFSVPRGDYDGQHFFEVFSWAPTGFSHEKLLPPSFSPNEFVVSYAVHLDERTIFITTRDFSLGHKKPLGHEKGTYSFDTKKCVWSWHGQWALPFWGQGFYDSELDAWVGLDLCGYVCCCEVASLITSSSKQRHPDWVKGKQLFKNDHEATLTCMGRNKFCLVESMARERLRDVPFVYRQNDRDTNLLQLTMFSLDYNRNEGKLGTNIHHPTRSYLVPKFTNSFPLGAIWM